MARRSKSSGKMGTSASSPQFPQFSLLPKEIRCKIWCLTLPDPRVMLVLRRPSKAGKYITTAASCGGHQPVTLHVNAESRAEALLQLTLRFGAYWNLETDAPYIEATDNSQLSVTQLAEMTANGDLKGFKHIAVDWTIWNWKDATSSMEFRVSFPHGTFDGYEHPLNSVSKLPDLETCTFIYTKHTLQSSLIVPYSAWSIGPMDAKSTLDERDWADLVTRGPAEILRKKEQLGVAHTKQNLVASPNPLQNWMVVEEKIPALNIRPEIEFSLGAIHGRKREILPIGKMYRPQAGWEMDWFG